MSGSSSLPLAHHPQAAHGGIVLEPSLPDQRQASPMVKALLGVLRGRPFEDVQLVFLAAEAFCRALPGSPREQRCLEALDACARETGAREPSRRAYDEWHRGLADRSERPSSGAIRDAFGSWMAALAVFAGRPEPDVTVRGLVARGRAHTREGLVETIRAYAAHLEASGAAPAGNALAVRRFLAWTREMRDSPARPGLELPVTIVPFLRVFGSWPQALEAAGLLASRARPGVSGEGACAHSSVRYTDAQLVQALRQAAEELGALPTMSQFAAWSERRRQAAAKAGVFVASPSEVTVVNRFGSWALSLAAAGLITHERALELAKGKHRAFIDEDLTGAIAACALELGRLPTRAEYARWRTSASRRLGLDSSSRVYPSDAGIRQRLGPWDQALAAAAAAHPELQHLPGPGRPTPAGAAHQRSSEGSRSRPPAGNATRPRRHPAASQAAA